MPFTIFQALHVQKTPYNEKVPCMLCSSLPSTLALEFSLNVSTTASTLLVRSEQDTIVLLRRTRQAQCIFMPSADIGAYHTTIASSRRALERRIFRLHTLRVICARALPPPTSRFDTTKETPTVGVIRMVALTRTVFSEVTNYQCFQVLSP